MTGHMINTHTPVASIQQQQRECIVLNNTSFITKTRRHLGIKLAILWNP